MLRLIAKLRETSSFLLLLLDTVVFFRPTRASRCFNSNPPSKLPAPLPTADKSLSLSQPQVCDSLWTATEGSCSLAAWCPVDPAGSADPAWTRLPLSFSIARARAAMLNSMSSEGRMSFSYVKQKSEDSPKVSVNVSHAEVLFLQTRPSGNCARLCSDNRPCVPPRKLLCVTHIVC